MLSFLRTGVVYCPRALVSMTWVSSVPITTKLDYTWFSLLIMAGSLSVIDTASFLTPPIFWLAIRAPNYEEVHN